MLTVLETVPMVSSNFRLVAEIKLGGRPSGRFGNGVVGRSPFRLALVLNFILVEV